MNTYPEIEEKIVKKETLLKMIENAKKSVIDNQVKIEYYEYLASLATDEKVAASWRVEADKTKVAKRGVEESLDGLEKFLTTF